MTKDLIAQHGLTDEEFQKIVTIIGREPNLTELGMFSVMWSEHCSYKSSRTFLKKLPTDASHVIQGPGENAGVVDIGDGLAAVFKMESHNHPSFIEPYQGAATGVGGILRDIFTMGARPIALLDSLRFGPLDQPRNRYLFSGVVSGVAGYGNCLAGNERVIIKVNGTIEDVSLESVGKRFFSDQVLGAEKFNTGAIQVLSFDPVLMEPRWANIKKLYKLRSNQTVKIKTAMGRTLVMTQDHLAVVAQNGKLVNVPASELRVGQEIPILTTFPFEEPSVKEIDLINIFEGYHADIYVRFNGNVEIPHHMLWHKVLRADARFRYRNKKAMPLKVYRALEKELILPRSSAQLYVPSGKANYIRAQLSVTGELARLVGYYLSEGCVSTNGTTYKLIWTFGRHEREYVDDLCQILRDLDIRYSVYQRQSTIAITVSSWFLGVLFKDHWKTGSSALEKNIPDLFLKSSQNVKRELLKGLFRGDGSVSFYPSGSRVKVRYATTSEKLFHQTILLLQELGLFPYIYTSTLRDGQIKGRRIKGGNKLFQVEFNNHADNLLLADWFSNPINRQIRQSLADYPFGGERFSYPRSKPHTHFSTVAIRSISHDEHEQDVYDLEVDDTHLFVTTSGIITHNCIGVPTVGGEVYFNEIYNHNPLVNVFCLGIARKDRIVRGRASGVGNPVLYIGSKTGRDGIHGATMASDSFDEGSESMRPTVQVGDPFMEKLLLEACLELMEKDLLVGIQDMGAAGLTSSSTEMASRAGTGIELELANVPRREPGMTPYEVLLSESQERMLLVAKSGREGEVLEICKKWDVDAAVIGRVTNDGVLRVKEKGVVVAEVPARALTDNAPTYERPADAPAYQDALQSLPLELVPEPKDCNAVLEALLTSPTIAHKGWVFEQYDHMVQTNTVIRPGSDAAVLRIKGTDKALAVTADCNSLHCVLNPYTGAASAVAEAARNLVCAGARPLALTDCLNFGNPERPDIMWQFILAVEGIADACKALQIPVVSGNVSFYNETRGLSIYPTPIIGMVGLLDHVEQAVSQGFKAEGDAILLLGETGEDLGGTEYLRAVHHREQGTPPVLNLEREVALQRAVLQAVEQGLVRSAHDCAEGGLAVALAESCLSATNGPLGAEIVLDRHGLRRDSLLFGESQSRIILSVKPANREKIEALARQEGVPCSVLGFVRGQRLMISIRDDRDRTALWIDRTCDKLDTMWRGALRAALETGEGGHA